MIKKYLIFAFNRHYPQGGFKDLLGTFDTIEEASAVVDTFNGSMNQLQMVNTANFHYSMLHEPEMDGENTNWNFSSPLSELQKEVLLKSIEFELLNLA